MVGAFQQAIAKGGIQEVTVELVSAMQLSLRQGENQNGLVYCPLTIDIPPQFQFSHRDVFHACRDIPGRRHWVEQKFGIPSLSGNNGLGDHWLPIVWTAKGPLYGEVICEGMMPNSYLQPMDLPDPQRQPLYRLGFGLLEQLEAPPAVYLLQFGHYNDQIIFDRLWPFPAAPAIASISLQAPDLFSCHWRCLTGQAIREVQVLPVG